MQEILIHSDMATQNAIFYAYSFPFVEFQDKKHLFSTGSQNSIITRTIKENVIQALVELNKLWPKVHIHCRIFPNSNNGYRNHFTSFLTQKKILPAFSEINSLEKQPSFFLVDIHMNTTSSPSFIVKCNVTTKESKLDNSHMYQHL